MDVPREETGELDKQMKPLKDLIESGQFTPVSIE